MRRTCAVMAILSLYLLGISYYLLTFKAKSPFVQGLADRFGFQAKCVQQRVAILVPYRNRPGQLMRFLDYMHPYLTKKNIDYEIFVIEQDEHAAFNRGSLFNIGAFYALNLHQAYPGLKSSMASHNHSKSVKEGRHTWYLHRDHVVNMTNELKNKVEELASVAERSLFDRLGNKSSPCVLPEPSSQLFDCFILHDVDLLPLLDTIEYTCGPNPTHMSSALEKWDWKLPYSTIFGGVCSLTPHQYLKANGFSNLYFGWGGEDDDMRVRISAAGMNPIHTPNGRYDMMAHKHEKPNPKRLTLLSYAKTRLLSDGFSHVLFQELEYSPEPGYTRIKVRVDENAILKNAGARKSK